MFSDYRHATTGWILGLAVVSFGCLATTRANDDAVRERALNRVGLEVQWNSHTGAGIRDGLVDWAINVDEDQATTYFEIKSDGYREVFSARDRGPEGQVLGMENGLAYAEIRKSIVEAELQAAGNDNVEVTVNQYTLPKARIYTLTSNAVVKSLDADTGKTIWTTRVGNPKLPSVGLGASDKHVVVVNGSSIYCLDEATGKIAWSHACRFAVSASPTVEGDDIYVPLMNSRLERFSIVDQGFNSRAYVASRGESTTPGVITPLTVAWGSSDGELNVAPRYDRRRGIAYQLQTNQPIVAPPVFADGMYYVTSMDGFIYALDEARGTVTWEVSTGTPISQAPVLLGSKVYVINDNHELYQFDSMTGKMAEGWETPRQGIGAFVGASESHLYVLSPTRDRVFVLNLKSGARVSSAPVGDIESILYNPISDRMFVTNSRGTIECIREIESNVPFYHGMEMADPAGEGEADGVDPNDPFAKPGQPQNLNADPFKQVAPPKANDDPFRTNDGR